MRKSIFEIANEKIDLASEVKRIDKVFRTEETLCIDSYSYKSIFKFVDLYCFNEWAYRNHFVDVNDFLNAIGYTDLIRKATTDTEALLTIIELVYNFWNLCYQELVKKNNSFSLEWCGNFFHLQDIMDDILAKYNHEAYTNDEGDCVIVVESKPEVTAVAEIIPSQISYDVIKYNHKSLQGEIEIKKAILISMGAELEPQRKELQLVNKQLADNIFFMLNNCNIRHNNRSKKDPGKYKEYVAKMTKKQMEKWYDELYQMILLAFLILDNKKREAKVNDLKGKIIGGNNNGSDK